MSRFIKLVVALIAVVMGVSCANDDNFSNGYLDVTPNNISGIWRMESYDNGITMEEGSYYYIDFVRKDKTFVSYDNLDSKGVRKRSGRYDITTNGAAVIRGKYDFEQGDWEHRYYVRDLTANRMVWVAVDDESIVTVYVRAELPEEFIE